MKKEPIPRSEADIRMSDSALDRWHKLARCTEYLLNHPDTPEGMFHAIEHFCDSILPSDENVGAHYARRIRAMGDGFAGKKTKRRKPGVEEYYEDWCQEFGNCVSEILGYHHTPEVFKVAAAELCATFEEWARREKEFAHSAARVRTILPELMYLASHYEISADEMTPGTIEVSPQSEAIM